MARPADDEARLHEAWRGAAEGAAFGALLVTLQSAKLYGESDLPGSALTIALWVIVFVAGRVISGNWVGSFCGALILGGVGVWVGVFSTHMAPESVVGPDLGVGIGAPVGAVLGALAERRQRLRRGVEKDSEPPTGGDLP